MTQNDHNQAGYAALAAGDWDTAKQYFEEQLRHSDDPDAHDGLGIALWWLNEIASSHEQRTAAFVAFKQRGEFHRAGKIAAWLAREQVFLYSNSSAMNGWFARAEHLLSQVEPCAEQGWLTFFRASMTEPPDKLLIKMDETIKIARMFGDSGLEVISIAFKGMSHIALGHIADGMACLDEAMTMATNGEVRDFMAISESFCTTLSACELAGDLVRSEHWCQAAAKFAEQHRCAFLGAYCKTTYGSLQVALGRWNEAEITLTEAIHLFEQGHRGLRIHAIFKLAELRACQGKLEEAEVLLTGYDDYSGAVVPFVRLYLARGQYAEASAILKQALAGSGETVTLHRVPLLALMVETALLLDDLDGAREAVNMLKQIAANTDGDLLAAQVSLVEGQIWQRAGNADAVSSFKSALDKLGAQESSLLSGRTRFEMAKTLMRSDVAGAIAWAKAALATFERIGAKHEAEKAVNLLRQLGVTARSGQRSISVLTERETEVLTLIGSGLANREIAQRLVISPKTVEHHVSQILGKLGLRRRSEAVAFVLKNRGDG